MKIVIVGGGTAGWFTAGFLSKKHPDADITLVESPNIPKIGVGESMHPYVNVLLNMMGVDQKDWMQKTGATLKLGNRYTGWVNGADEYTYSAFTFSFDPTVFEQGVTPMNLLKGWPNRGYSNVDYALELINTSNKRFDQVLLPSFHYMENLTVPIDTADFSFNPLYTYSNHINADTSADYIRDVIAIPNGVKHIQQKVTNVVREGEVVKSLLLESSNTLEADLFVDCSGFAKILVKDWKYNKFEDNPIDRAWVCQMDYEDPHTELTNYTQSIAQPHGWRFKIGLMERMGNGYCYSSSHISDEQALDHFNTLIKNKRTEPRLLKWTPERLETFAKGNVAAIGLSCGFVEPLEASAIFVIASSIISLSDAIAVRKGTSLDFTNYNSKLDYLINDIAQFACMHYALSHRTDTDFWLDMKQLKSKYQEIPHKKYMGIEHTMLGISEGRSLIAEFGFAHRANMFGVDTTTWYNNDPTILQFAKEYYTKLDTDNQALSKLKMNNYEWHKKYIFDR